MITIQNVSFAENKCIRSRINNVIRNEALDGSQYGKTIGYRYVWNIECFVSENDLDYIENLELFDFVDSSGQKAKARIFEQISIQNKYLSTYLIQFTVEEALT